MLCLALAMAPPALPASGEPAPPATPPVVYLVVSPGEAAPGLDASAVLRLHSIMLDQLRPDLPRGVTLADTDARTVTLLHDAAHAQQVGTDNGAPFAELLRPSRVSHLLQSRSEKANGVMVLSATLYTFPALIVVKRWEVPMDAQSSAGHGPAARKIAQEVAVALGWRAGAR